MSKKIKTRRLTPPTRLVAGMLLAICFVLVAVGLSSCNVTRKVTTQSEYVQKGDTAVMIVTKTIESYDASKKVLNY